LAALHVTLPSGAQTAASYVSLALENLQGDIDFWDPKRLKKIGTAKAHCAAYYEWSPDGSFLLTAVLSPRIRVDNGYKIWNYEGTLIYEEVIQELLQAAWRPALPGVFPNKAPLFSKKDEAVETKVETKAPAKYRHPNFSGNATVVREEDKPKKFATPKKTEQQLPPGMTPNKKKKKPKKKTEDGQEKPPTPQPAAAQKAAPPTVILDEEERQKRIRNLTKKLRQIQQLKEDQEQGKEMNPSQLEKIATEQDLTNELNSL